MTSASSGRQRGRTSARATTSVSPCPRREASGTRTVATAFSVGVR